jgi:hypothetical protein
VPTIDRNRYESATEQLRCALVIGDDHRVGAETCGERLREHLYRAELAGDLSEFDALSFQAILAIAEGTEDVDDFLEMAEEVAVAERELAIVAGIRAARDRVQGNVGSIPSHGAMSDELAELWHSLLSALNNLAKSSAR